MPKKGSNDTILRHWAMLKLIPHGANRGLTTSDLADRLAGQGFVVDIRTVQRDLIKLSVAFPLTCSEEDKAQHWYWMENASLDIPGMAVSDALTLKMVEEYLAPLIPASILEVLNPHLSQATRTLTAMERDNQAARWTEKIRVVHPSIAMKAPSIEAKVLATIQDALLHNRQVDVEYQSFGSDCLSCLRLHPLALVQRGPATYLVATTFDYNDIRLYALHRFTTAVLLNDPADRPETFDIDAYISAGGLHFSNGEIINLQLWVNDQVAELLRESPLSNDMDMQPSGNGYCVSATLPHTWQLKWWLLSQSGQVLIQAPIHLKDSIIESLQESLQLHSAS